LGTVNQSINQLKSIFQAITKNYDHHHHHHHQFTSPKGNTGTMQYNIITVTALERLPEKQYAH